VTSPTSIPTALRNHADGSHCLEAAAELFIVQVWLHRPDFTRRFLTIGRALTDARPMANIDWPAAITALNAGELPCSGGERRMLRLTASLADGVPVDLREALTGIDNVNLGHLITAIRRACGQH
jgi:hypothetical protein